jgi:hypothetical protein
MDHRVRVRCFAVACLGALAPYALAAAGAGAEGPKPDASKTSLVARFSGATAGPGGQLPAPWRLVALPKRQPTQFSIVEFDGTRVLRVDADASYANVLQEFDPAVAARSLHWRWRVDRPVHGADLTRRDGDDAPARLCVLFDVPPARLSWATRALLSIWRAVFDPRLPAATLCYVWDDTLAPGTWLPNAYTDRVRMLVLQRGRHGRWLDESRDLAADFAFAFEREARGGLPPVLAVGVSGDADNTRGRSLAYVGDIDLR